MRVLILGRSKRTSAESAIRRALERAGHPATILDDRRVARRIGSRGAVAWLRARAGSFRPEHVIVGKGLGMPVDALAELCGRPRVGSVMWYHDLNVPPTSAVIERACRVNSVFLTAGGQAGAWEGRGVNQARFLPSAADPYENRPATPSRAFGSDVAFIGFGEDPHRSEFVERLSKHFNTRIWGGGWTNEARDLGWTGAEARGRDFARVCASAKIVVGIERSFQVEDPVPYYASNRIWRVLACGGFYLGRATPGMPELLRNGVHCAWYDDVEHACHLIEKYLGNANERDRVRRAGRDFVLRHHTFDSRLGNLLSGTPFRNPLGAPVEMGTANPCD